MEPFLLKLSHRPRISVLATLKIHSLSGFFASGGFQQALSFFVRNPAHTLTSVGRDPTPGACDRNRTYIGLNTALRFRDGAITILAHRQMFPAGAELSSAITMYAVSLAENQVIDIMEHSHL